MDDDTESDSHEEHGGVVFAYDKHRIKLWAPNASNGRRNGHIMFLATVMDRSKVLLIRNWRLIRLMYKFGHGDKINAFVV